MSELLVVQGGRIRPQLGPVTVIETGIYRVASLANAGLNIASADDAVYARFVPTKGGVLQSLQVYFNTSGSTPQIDHILLNDLDGEPGETVLDSVNSIVPASGGFGAEATMGGTPTIVAGTPYWIKLLWRQGTAQVGWNPGLSSRGGEVRYTQTAASPNANSPWMHRQNADVPIRLNYVSGQWTNVLGAGSTSGGNVGMHGNPDSGSGCFNGWRFKAPRNLYYLGSDVSWRSVYADPALANAMVMRVYRVGETTHFAVSRNSLAATTLGASNTNRIGWLGMVDWDAVESGDYRTLVRMREGKEYDLAACQQGTGGSSDSSNRVLLDGSVTTQYTFNPPTTTDENSQGFVSMSSSTGYGNFAANTTCGYWGRHLFLEAGERFRF